MRNHAQMLSGFPYGRTKHIRHMRSSIVSVIHYLSMRYFICGCVAFRITHRSVQQISSAVFNLQ